MENTLVKLLPNVSEEVVKDITGFKLDAYLIALEGWRRGLQLKWYKDETDVCKLDRLKSSTHGKFFSLSTGEKTHYFFRSRGDKVSNKAVRLVQDKEKTKTMLAQNGVPVPIGQIFSIDGFDKIKQFASGVGYPIVIKPVNGSMGKGVYTNIQDEEELTSSFNDYCERFNFSDVMVEKYYPGNEYRIYVVGEKVVVATNRIPANITGNGHSTVRDLIEEKNMKRKLNPYLAPKPIKVDFEIKNSLKEKGYSLDSIPAKDEVVFLRKKSNLSAGGDPIEATDELTPGVKKIAVDTLKALPSIPHAGVDIIVDPESTDKGVVLEVNATAEIAFHLFPLEGNAKDLPGIMIDYYFPETIGSQRTNAYFDFLSILEPLKTGAVDEIAVANRPNKDILGKKYIVTGKVNRVGYMNWIKRRALRFGLNGYVKQINRNTIEVFVVSDNKKKVLDFKKECYNGSKRSVVKNVEVQDWDVDLYKLGFEIISLEE